MNHDNLETVAAILAGALVSGVLSDKISSGIAQPHVNDVADKAVSLYEKILENLRSRQSRKG